MTKKVEEIQLVISGICAIIPDLIKSISVSFEAHRNKRDLQYIALLRDSQLRKLHGKMGTVPHYKMEHLGSSGAVSSRALRRLQERQRVKLVKSMSRERERGRPKTEFEMQRTVAQVNPFWTFFLIGFSDHYRLLLKNLSANLLDRELVTACIAHYASSIREDTENRIDSLMEQMPAPKAGPEIIKRDFPERGELEDPKFLERALEAFRALPEIYAGLPDASPGLREGFTHSEIDMAFICWDLLSLAAIAADCKIHSTPIELATQFITLSYDDMLKKMEEIISE